jgi:predicted lipoprotein
LVERRAGVGDGALVALGLALLVSVHACAEISSSTTSGSGSSAVAGGGGLGTGGAGPSRLSDARIRQVLAHLANEVIAPSYFQAATAASQFDAAAKSYAAEVTDVNRDKAQQAWREGMKLWQAAELMQIGPAGAADLVLAGDDLRDEIYTWPLLNRCRVEQEIVEGNYAAGSAFAAEAVNVRGYDAAEQLLFDAGASNGCPPQNPINLMGGWDAIAPELTTRRADYSATLSGLITTQSWALSEKWQLAGGDFTATLSSAGASSAVYPTAVSGLNAVSDAMFYFEKMTKDRKLAKPLGLVDCDASICPDDFESPYAHADKAHIVANIDAFALLLSGGEGDALGFDDLLADLGAQGLATSMLEGLEKARTAALAVPGNSLREAIQTDEASVRAVYDAVQVVTGMLKGEFVDTLGLELPKSVQSDND